NQGHKLIAINNMPDHFHLLVGLKPTMALSDLVGEIKASSSAFIKKSRWINGRFEWQEGYGAFSYSHSQPGTVIKYICDQQKHHSRKTFREEYLALLKKFEIAHEERYAFTFFDEQQD
ncbi:MAG: IS200/IS605 family transposase, partial [Limisphaerales bacterium]